MAHQPTIPEDLVPLVDAVTERLMSRLIRQHITQGLIPQKSVIDQQKSGMRLIVAEAVEAILKHGYVIKRTSLYENLLESVLDMFRQACWDAKTGKYDNMCMSSYESAQYDLLEAGAIKPEECLRPPKEIKTATETACEMTHPPKPAPAPDSIEKIVEEMKFCANQINNCWEDRDDGGKHLYAFAARLSALKEGGQLQEKEK